MGYLTNFIVYTLAMVGVIGIALLIFKGATNGGSRSSGKFLKVIDTLSIGARKNLYIVSAGEEKFLIAGDVDRTTLISKLNPSSQNLYEEKISSVASLNTDEYSTQSFRETLPQQKFPVKKEFMDKSIVGIKNSLISKSAKEAPYASVMRNLAAKMQGGISVSDIETTIGRNR